MHLGGSRLHAIKNPGLLLFLESSRKVFCLFTCFKFKSVGDTVAGLWTEEKEPGGRREWRCKREQTSTCGLNSPRITPRPVVEKDSLDIW